MAFFPVSQSAAVTHDASQGQGHGKQGAIDFPTPDVMQQRHEKETPSHANGCKHKGDEKHTESKKDLVVHGGASSKGGVALVLIRLPRAGVKVFSSP
jgi:hypothetical protein